MDFRTPGSLHETERFHDTSSNSVTPNPSKRYIVYTDTSDDACRAQLMQEHDGTEFPIAFLSHTFWRPKESGVQLNKRPMEFNML